MSDLPPIIGLCGAIGAGKDTAAEALQQLGYESLSFAKALKESVATMFPWVPRCHFFGTQEEKAQLLFMRGTQRWTGRKLLEYLGTDVGRSILADIWVRAAMEEVNRQPGQLWVAPDVRFPNEAVAIRQRGGVIWEVIREGDPQETSNHASDNAWRAVRKNAYLIARSGDVITLQLAAILLAKAGGRNG